MNKQVERAKEWLEGQGFICSVREWSDSCELWAAGGFVITVRKYSGKRWKPSKLICRIRFWTTHAWDYAFQGLKDESLLDKVALYDYIKGVE